MNQSRYGLMAVLLFAALLVLQGCGGDDNGSGISQDMYDALQADYDAAVTARDAAMAGQASAEAAATAAMEAQEMAMTAQTAAEAAQAAAEARRDSAVAAEAVATAAAAAAETAKMEAEATAAAAVTAKEAADAAAAAANLDVVAANAARDLAMSTQMAAEAARDAALTAQMMAEAAQEMAETERDAAVMAQTAAETARDAAVMAQTAAETARDAAMTAQMTAETDRDAAMTAQMTAEDERDAALAAQMTAEMERDAALAALATQTDADSAQRARVDAAAIQRAAGALNAGIDYDGDGDFTDVYDETALGYDVNGDGDALDTNVSDRLPTGSTTNTVTSSHVVSGALRIGATYQGSGAIPGDRGATAGVNGTFDGNEMLSLTATRAGNAVTFTAAADTDTTDAVSANVLINVMDATAGADGMTSHMAEVALPGGRTRNINLVSDIQAATTSLFSGNVPPGLGALVFDIPTQTSRYPINDNVQTDGITPIATAAATDQINAADNPSISFTPPAAFMPSATVPVQTVPRLASLDGSYAGVAGSYMCTAGAGQNCTLSLNGDGELLLDAVDNTGTSLASGTGWAFVPTADAITITDGDYYVYGAWLDRPDSAVGTSVAAAIAAGNDIYAVANITALTGAATYNGSAAGFFAERHVNSDAAVSGSFTADAALTANFSTATNGGTISGSITNFVRDDDVATDWLVNLGPALIGNVPVGTAVATIAGYTTGRTTGTASGAAWTGNWGVQFLGDGPDAGTVGLHPSGVVGTFGAQQGVATRLTDEPGTGETIADQGFAAVVGGFGAR